MTRGLVVACALLGLWVVPVRAVDAAPEAGVLLVARAELPDPRFREAVILLVQQGPEGAVGLILNRPSRLALAEVLPKLPKGSAAAETLSYGGPVAPRAFLVLLRVQEEPPEPSRLVLGNVYLTGPNELAAWFENNPRPTAYRVFAGYSGWSPGQLEREMTRGDWQVLPADEELLLAADTAGLWQALMAKPAAAAQ